MKMKRRIFVTGLLLGLGILLAGNASFASDRFYHRQKGYTKLARNHHVDGRKHSVRIHKRGYYEKHRHGGYHGRGYYDGRYPHRGYRKWRHHPRKYPHRGYYYGKRYHRGYHGYPSPYWRYPGWVFGFSFGGFF
jgi:hypothetical protein